MSNTLLVLSYIAKAAGFIAGNFASSSNWTQYVAGWTISGGSANSTAGNGVMYQGITTTNGLYYAVTYTISGYSAGYVNLDIGFAQGGTTPGRSANGTYTEIISSTEGSNLVFYGTNFTGSISNVSVVAINATQAGMLTQGATAYNTASLIPIQYGNSANCVTGSGTPTFGTNCPATTTTAPYRWLKMKTDDGSTVYVPAWK
jgi:hypothetical protein